MKLCRRKPSDHAPFPKCYGDYKLTVVLKRIGRLIADYLYLLLTFSIFAVYGPFMDDTIVVVESKCSVESEAGR